MNITINRSAWLQMQQHIQKTNADNPQTSFADGLEQTAGTAAAPATTSELLGKLSDKSVALLKKMKADPNYIDNDDWLNLMAELKEAGAISETEYTDTYISEEGGVALPVIPGFTEIYLWETQEGKGSWPDNPLKMLEEMGGWPGNPLEKLENLALFARKCIGILDVSKDDEGNPGSWYNGPFVKREASCLNVLKVVKELAAAA